MRTRLIHTLFPDEVHTVATEVEGDPDSLHPQEAAYIRRARIKRQREFAAGRQCARQALAHFGIRDFPLLSGQDRAPVWPRTLVGSLSHCSGYCGVAVARECSFAGIGLDVESGDALTSGESHLILNPKELAHLRTWPNQEAGVLAKTIFSAKESVFKCLYPLIRRSFEFDQCTIRIGELEGEFTATLDEDVGFAKSRQVMLHGRASRDGRRVYTGVWIRVREWLLFMS